MKWYLLVKGNTISLQKDLHDLKHTCAAGRKTLRIVDNVMVLILKDFEQNIFSSLKYLDCNSQEHDFKITVGRWPTWSTQ